MTKLPSVRSLPVDLDLHVERRYRHGEPILSYELSSPSGKAPDVFTEELHTPALRQLKSWERRLYKQLERLHHSLDVDANSLRVEDVERELTTLGHSLYECLLPVEWHPPRGIYERLHKVESLRIFSDEPWIPWELIKAPNDDCFALRFRLGYWPGAIAAVTSAHVQRMAILESPVQGQTVLAEAAAEISWLESWAKEVGIEVDRFRGTTLTELEEFLLAERRQLYHFVTHGRFDPKQPDESILLQTSPPFRSRHLSAALAQHLGQDRPFVVANACDAGRQGWALTGVAGWAERWLRWGCSGFLGLRWSVEDGFAREFVERFYRGLRDLLPVGEAVRRARRELKNRHRERLEWLAYSLYAHPNARLALGKSSGWNGHG